MWLFATVALVLVALFLFKFPRQTLIVLGSLLAIATLGAAYVWWENEGATALREVSVSYSPTTPPCSVQFPLRLVLSNRSSVRGQIDQRDNFSLPSGA